MYLCALLMTFTFKHPSSRGFFQLVQSACVAQLLMHPPVWPSEQVLSRNHTSYLRWWSICALQFRSSGVGHGYDLLCVLCTPMLTATCVISIPSFFADPFGYRNYCCNAIVYTFNTKQHRNSAHDDTSRRQDLVFRQNDGCWGAMSLYSVASWTHFNPEAMGWGMVTTFFVCWRVPAS